MGGGAGSAFASPRFNSRTKVKRNDTFLTMGDEGSASHSSPFRNMNYEGTYFLAVHLTLQGVQQLVSIVDTPFLWPMLMQFINIQ